MPVLLALLLVLSLALAGCNLLRSRGRAVELSARQTAEAAQVIANATPLDRVNAAAIEQTTQTTAYDPAYAKLDYPNGDVPITTGVCADVVVRAFRRGGVDLQQELHEDMRANFKQYPQRWGAKRTDSNIDHRRVPNLMKWFERQGKSLSLTDRAADYLPGDVVMWQLNNGLLHTGLVSKIKVGGTDRYAIVHNLGAGARLEDVLFLWPIIGHYRYFGNEATDKGR